MKLCQICNTNQARLKRPKTSQALCTECFYDVFESEIHNTIINEKLFIKGQCYVLGMSGGKDSTVLAFVLNMLNKKYNYGVDLLMVSVDEGIKGYRDDSLESVKRNQAQLNLPLKIISYEDDYQGWTMDNVVKQIGTKNNCTYCGVFRRQALEKGAQEFAQNHEVAGILTGHNADDMAETVLMNMLRGDYMRLQKCCHIATHATVTESIPRLKPFKYTYEKEIVMYAHFKKLDYFSTECIYSPNAFRGNARYFLKDLERIKPVAILDIIKSGEDIGRMVKVSPAKVVTQKCSRCGYITNNTTCKACSLLEQLNQTRISEER